MGTPPLVSAREVMSTLDIPRSTLYWFVRTGQVPAHDVTKSWQRVKRYAFVLEDVRAALQNPNRKATTAA